MSLEYTSSSSNGSLKIRSPWMFEQDDSSMCRRNLVAGMQLPSQEVAWNSAAALSHLVTIQGCPVSSFQA